jgi:hypothetical protein
LEFLARVIRWEEEIKGIPIGKEELKLFLFADDIIFFLKDSKESPKTSRHHKHLLQISRTQNQFIKISKAFLYTNTEQIEKEYRKTIPFTIASKNTSE